MLVVPALKGKHVERTLQAGLLFLHASPGALDQLLALPIGGRPLRHPLHKLANLTNLQARALETLDELQGFELAVAKTADTRSALHVGKQPLLIVVA